MIDRVCALVLDEVKQRESFTNSDVALVMSQLFHLFFGGYLIGLDQFY